MEEMDEVHGGIGIGGWGASTAHVSSTPLKVYEHRSEINIAVFSEDESGCIIMIIWLPQINERESEYQENYWKSRQEMKT